MIELAEEADLSVVECANSEEIYVEHHLSPKDIAVISERAKVKRIVLSHFYPHSEKVEVNTIKEKFKGEIILAKDLIEIEI